MLQVKLFWDSGINQVQQEVNAFLERLQKNVVEPPVSMPNIPQWHLQMASDEKGTTIMVTYWDKSKALNNEQITIPGKD